MKLSVWAKKNGISYMTAWRWFRDGKLPVKATQTKTGTVLIEEVQEIKSQISKAIIYCRVSTYQKKDDLNRQLERCIKFCETKGWEIQKSYKEIASGMNDNRKMLNEILNNVPNILVVEHKDRLTRFGFNYLETLLSKLGCQVCVINRDSEEQEDLMKDLISIITSFCCRLYGLRRGQNKAKKIKEELNQNTEVELDETCL